MLLQYISFFTIIFIISIFSQHVYAKNKDIENLPWDRFSLNVGVFVASLDSDIQLGTKGVGVSVDLEETLGLDTTMFIFRVDGSWRFTRNLRHRLDFSWYDLSRDTTRTLPKKIEIGNTEFEGEVKSSLDIQVFKGAYSYSFFQDDRFDLSASLGLYVMPIKFEIKSTGRTILPGPLTFERESESITAPLPVLGIYLDFAFTPKVFLSTTFELFYLKFDQYKGSLANASMALEYNAFKHIGFGIALESFIVSIEADGEDYPGIDLKGNIDFNFKGVLLYTKIYF